MSIIINIFVPGVFANISFRILVYMFLSETGPRFSLLIQTFTSLGLKIAPYTTKLGNMSVRVPAVDRATMKIGRFI